MYLTFNKLIQVYIIGTVLAFLWIFCNFATWCPDEGNIDTQWNELLARKLHDQKISADILRLQVDELKAELRNSKNHAKVDNYKSYRLPFIYVVTPTHTRPEQKAELTRLSHTLRLVDNVHWIVVEDADEITPLVANLLRTSNLMYTHLHATTPQQVKLKSTDPKWLKPRGVPQRNAGLHWIQSEATRPGVVYFADDDNTYDLQIFKEMRYTRKVSVWPVGLVGGLKYESPVVRNRKVTGWYTYWKPSRPFACDMAGFAVNTELIKNNTQAEFKIEAGRGEIESVFLRQLGVTWDDLEVRADNCTKVLVWHTQTVPPTFKNEARMLQKYGYNSDTNIEV